MSPTGLAGPVPLVFNKFLIGKDSTKLQINLIAYPYEKFIKKRKKIYWTVYRVLHYLLVIYTNV